MNSFSVLFSVFKRKQKSRIFWCFLVDSCRMTSLFFIEGRDTDFCATRDDGYYPYPEDCRYYFQCTEHATKKFKCAFNGMVFVGKSCVFSSASTAKCDKGQYSLRNFS